MKFASTALTTIDLCVMQYTQEHVREGKPDMNSAELDSICRNTLRNWEHQLDVVL